MTTQDRSDIKSMLDRLQALDPASTEDVGKLHREISDARARLYVPTYVPQVSPCTVTGHPYPDVFLVPPATPEEALVRLTLVDLAKLFALARGQRRDPHRPSVETVHPFVRYYTWDLGHRAGGSLHIVLEDQNLRDSDVRFCLWWAVEHGDLPGFMLALLLLQMSQTQREKVR